MRFKCRRSPLKKYRLRYHCRDPWFTAGGRHIVPCCEMSSAFVEYRPLRTIGLGFCVPPSRLRALNKDGGPRGDSIRHLTTPNDHRWSGIQKMFIHLWWPPWEWNGIFLAFAISSACLFWLPLFVMVMTIGFNLSLRRQLMGDLYNCWLFPTGFANVFLTILACFETESF